MNLFSRCLGSPLNRRNFLHVGAIGALGLTLDQYMRLQAAEPAGHVETSRDQPAGADGGEGAGDIGGLHGIAAGGQNQHRLGPRGADQRAQRLEFIIVVRVDPGGIDVNFPLAGGLQRLGIQTAEGVIPFVCDSSMKDDRGYLLTKDTWRMVHLSDAVPARITDAAGNDNLFEGTGDAVQIRYYAWWNLKCIEPAANGVFAVDSTQF